MLEENARKAREYDRRLREEFGVHARATVRSRVLPDPYLTR